MFGPETFGYAGCIYGYISAADYDDPSTRGGSAPQVDFPQKPDGIDDLCGLVFPLDLHLEGAVGPDSQKNG
jgi:hypothetical protein